MKNLENLARKINKRMVKIAQELGKDSTLYQRYASTISAGLDVTDPEQVYYNSKGILQIKRNKNNLSQAAETLEIVDQLPTYQKVYKKTEKEIKEERYAEDTTKPTKDEIITRILSQDNTKKYITDNIAAMYVEMEHNGAPINRFAQEAIGILKNKRNTWGELEKAVDMMIKAENAGIQEFNYFTELEDFGDD